MSALSVQLGRLKLANPILVASGTFGYAREMENFVDLARLGGIVPKTVTREPRIGNPPPRTVETSAGMLNSIGLDNDGLDLFLEKHLPYLRSLGTTIIVNIAGRTVDDYREMAEQLESADGVDAVELNISCPNVSGGVDFGTVPERTFEVVQSVKHACRYPILAKLTPNVTNIVPIAEAAANAGADALSLVNTFQGMAIDWRRRKAVLGNTLGGLSGPAIKPLALRIVWQVARAVEIPIVGIGGIANIDDVMEFLAAGASAVQLGTANFYHPTLANEIINQLEELVDDAGVRCFIGTLHQTQPETPQPASCAES